MRIILSIVACVLLCIALPAQAKRIALVMGNDNYTSVSKLQKAGNDATAMARELKAAGFTVQLHRDLNYLGMVKAVETFTNGITGGDEVVVFFAGHGVQIKNGSYLLPTDIEANSESQVEKTAYELLALTDKISEAKPAFSLVMVDACRDNPLKSKGRNIGNARGLSAMEPPKGQMVVYSASRGQQALDRLSDKDPNPNGVFTREFITQMQKPGVRIEDIMRSVQDSVEALAKTISHEQRPAVYNEARGNFYFFGPITVQAAPLPPAKPDSSALELAMWDGVKNATTVAEVQAYLSRFPNGFFSELARARIVAIGSVKVETVSAVGQVESPEQQSNAANKLVSTEIIKDSNAALTNNTTLIASNQNSSTQSIAPQISNLSKPGSTIKDCEDCPEMVVIPAGSFEMGLAEVANSIPVRTVNVQSFLMGKTEVTRGQWSMIMGDKPYLLKECGDQCPVVPSWKEMNEFINRLNQKTGKNYRLPSEIEWEFAARGGRKTKWSFGEDESLLGNYAWYKKNVSFWAPGYQFVAQKIPNDYGLYDIHGNVAELVQDELHIKNSYGVTNKFRIARGGSFHSDSEDTTSTIRQLFLAAIGRGFPVGFRLARDK
jgi:formylglycine-generating enzyme required for sulfatase activity